MQFSNRRQTADFLSSWEERDALARAEYLCDQAELIHREARAEAEALRAAAKAAAADLINRALTQIEAATAQSLESLRRQQAHEQAAATARHEAELLLEQALAAAAAPATIDLRETAPARI
jgi:hypothetical protein